MKRIDVVHGDNGWVGRSGGRTIVTGETKQQAVLAAAEAAKRSADAVSVRIHKRNGQIQEERTYPRSADPRSSRG